MSKSIDFKNLTRDEIIQNLRYLGVNVDALLSIYPVTTTELRDLLKGCSTWGIGRPFKEQQRTTSSS